MGPKKKAEVRMASGETNRLLPVDSSGDFELMLVFPVLECSAQHYTMGECFKYRWRDRAT